MLERQEGKWWLEVGKRGEARQGYAKVLKTE